MSVWEYTDCSGNVLFGKIKTEQRKAPKAELLISGLEIDYDQYFKIEDTFASAEISGNYSFAGEHNFSGIVTEPNYYKGSAGFNYETVGTSGTGIAWVDSATLYNGLCDITGVWQGHNNVLRLQDDATAGENPRIIHYITQAVDGVFECWIATNDVTEDWELSFYDSSVSWIIRLRIYDSAIDYLDDGDVWQEICAAVNNTWYHIRVQWYANNTFDVYVNGTLQVDGVNCNNEMSSGVDRIYLIGYGDSTDYLYFDAPGLVGETDPQSHVYKAGWNMLNGDIDGLLDEGYTLQGALGGSYIRVVDLDGHIDVLKIYDNQGDIDIGDACGLIISFNEQSSGNIEFLMNTSDIDKIFYIRIYDGSTSHRIQLFVDTNKLYYYDGSSHEIMTLASNTWYHFRITFDCSGVWNLWVNGIKKDDGSWGYVGSPTAMDNIQFITHIGDSNYSYYIDAVDFSWASGYKTNRNAAKISNEIVFEGFVGDFDGKTKNKVELFSRHYELDDVYPTGTYAGTIDVIASGLIRDWTNQLDCNSNTLQAGTIGMTGIFNGNKKMADCLTNLCKIESFNWYEQNHNGKLYMGTGFYSYVSFTGSEDVYGIDKKQVRHKNKVYLDGGFTAGSKLASITGDIADQGVYGVMATKDDNSIIKEQGLLDSGAKNFLDRVMSPPLRYRIKDGVIATGMLQVGEKILLDEGIPLVGYDGNLATGQYYVNKVVYDLKSRVSDIYVSDSIFYGEPKDMPVQNATRVDQLNTDVSGNTATLNLKPTVYINSDDPDVNDDVTFGYKRGDIWVNTSDDGTFICRNPADGAADWKEI